MVARVYGVGICRASRCGYLVLPLVGGCSVLSYCCPVFDLASVVAVGSLVDSMFVGSHKGMGCARRNGLLGTWPRSADPGSP